MHTRDEVLKASLNYFKGDELAANVFVNKYALEHDSIYYELTPADMHDRLAKEFYRIEQKYPNPRSYQSIRASFDNFKYIVPGGSPMQGIGNPYSIMSLSNCVVVGSPEDTMSSIYEKGRDLANLFKRRCGVGLDISSLRPDGSLVRNSAKTSSGAWSFAELYSYICNHTGQSGRRGALMLTMHIDHPDIENFVTMKQDLTKVTGANVSVMLDDNFMTKVENDKDLDLIFNNKIYKTIKAKDLWLLICECACKTAEPGLIFIDNYKKNLPLNCYEGFESISVNPCSEIALSPYDSCRLISLNLYSFVENNFSKDAYFNFTELQHYSTLAMRLMDDLVDLEIEALKRIQDAADTKDEISLFGKLIDAAEKGRRTGLGTFGFADVCLALGIAYDSNKAIGLADSIWGTLRDTAYYESINLAIERGPFPIFNWKTEKDCDFWKKCPAGLIEMIKVYGRRNGAILTQAPTGTTAIMGQRNSAIEPFFRFSYTKRYKITDETQARVDFTDALGIKYQEFEVYPKTIKEWMAYNGYEKFPEVLPDYMKSSDNIDWQKRIKIQGVIQEKIDHGISSTINLPKGTSVETVQQLYINAWKQGLKGVTVYVDGSRSGILVTKEEPTIKRPEKILCDAHKINNTAILIGLLNDKPFEVFGGNDIENHFKTKLSHGFIVKSKNKKKNTYTYEGVDKFIPHIESYFENERGNSTGIINRMISLSLRHKIPIEIIVDQLMKDKQSEFWSYQKQVARILKHYIKEGTTSTNKCAECGEKALIYESGCFMCISCGHTACG